MDRTKVGLRTYLTERNNLTTQIATNVKSLWFIVIRPVFAGPDSVFQAYTQYSTTYFGMRAAVNRHCAVGGQLLVDRQ